MAKTNAYHIRRLMLAACLPALMAAPLRLAAQDGGDGRWRLYPSYADITEIEPTGKSVFVLASNNLYSYNPDDQSVTTYDKTNALSGVEIRHIAWSKAAGRLVVVYDDSNIDLLARDGSATNVPDLYMKETTFDKTVNSIYIYGRYAYLATGFGIVKLDAADGSMAESYQLGFAVDHCRIDGGMIYAASAERQATYGCALDGNLMDPANWSRTGGYEPLSADRTNVYEQAHGRWWTNTADGRLMAYTVDADGNRTYTTGGVAPDGPSSNNFYRLYMDGGKLYAVSGLWSQETDGQRPGEVHVWDGEEWSEFEKPEGLAEGHSFVDPLCLDFDPAEPGHVMVGAKSGMYEYRDGAFVRAYNRYGKYDSGLESEFNGYNYTLVTGVKYDASGDLWVLNSQTGGGTPLKKLDDDGATWHKFAHAELSGATEYELANPFISPTNGLMWFTNNFFMETRLFAYDPAADRLTAYGPRYVNQYGTQLEPHYVFGCTEDRLGNVWMATDIGPIYLSAESIRDGSDTFTQHAVPRNDGTNYADLLLSGIDIRAIAVDGGNRKWIGTNSSGVFLISGDNNTQISHFTADNSPLPSNIVQGIAVDGTTGQVYFATDKGLCSYRADATEPSAEMTKDNVYAYPNPVRPDYTGPITVVGLTADAEVKIVTADGALVNQGRSTGGTYTWDGCDLKGRRVASGVYMVETSTADGGKGTVCKIAVVN